MKCKERRFRSSTSDQKFTCLKCSDNIKLSRSLVQNHLRKHRLSLQDYLDKYDLSENRDMLVNIRLWVQNQDYMLQLTENAERRRSQSGPDQERETAAETITSVADGVADKGEGDEDGLGDDG